MTTHNESSMSNFFDLSKPTFIENWPVELVQLSIAQVDVPLTREDAIVLGVSNLELNECFAEAHPDEIKGVDADQGRKRLVDRFSEGIAKFPRGCFVRLGSRSPKDSWYGLRHGFKVSDGKAALKMLTGASERVWEDLEMCLSADYLPHVFLREWIEIPRWAEFRCFMRDCKLVGVSQYYYSGAFAELWEWSNSFTFAIKQFFDSFKSASHLDSVVFDVFVKARQSGNERHLEVKLLEINPFGEWTDPCFFDWRNGGDFDATFRFKDPDGNVVKGAVQ